jgi:antitoxin HigA-1
MPDPITTPEAPLPAPERQREPTHPGAFMREIIEEQLGLTLSDAAQRMELDVGTLQRVVRGTERVSAEIALRFTRLAGGEPSLFLAMQDELDLWRECRRHAVSLARIAPAKTST